MNRLYLLKSGAAAVTLVSTPRWVAAQQDEPRLTQAWLNLKTDDDDKKQGSVFDMQLVDLKPNGGPAHVYATWSSGTEAYTPGEPLSPGFNITDTVLRLGHWRGTPVHLLGQFSGVDDDTWTVFMSFHLQFQRAGEPPPGKRWQWDFGRQVINTTGGRLFYKTLSYAPL